MMDEVILGIFGGIITLMNYFTYKATLKTQEKQTELDTMQTLTETVNELRDKVELQSKRIAELENIITIKEEENKVLVALATKIPVLEGSLGSLQKEYERLRSLLIENNIPLTKDENND